MTRALVVLVLALAALVALGRLEADRRGDAENTGMRRVLGQIEPIDSTALSGYRRQGPFDCLTYARGRDPFALEICVDPSGRVVEALDRRSADLKVWSLRDDPSRSDVKVDRGEVDRLLREMAAPGA